MISEGERVGWKAITLASDELSVTVLPEKGADIYELVDRSLDLDLLFKAPWGLQPPGSAPREGSGGMPFLHNYEGCWQELFPNADAACTVDGVELPFHGEVATLPWQVEQDGDELVCRVECRLVPLALERRMRVDGTTLTLSETVVNRGEREQSFVWGHHCVLGAPFLEAGCRLHAPAETIETIAEIWDETARLAHPQRERWPHAALRDSGTVDLSRVPGSEVGSHDDVYLTDLSHGFVAVENPRLGRTFRLSFDRDLFPFLISWQPYGGARAMPLRGCYALGVEPWVSRGNLADAIECGQARRLAAGARMQTVLTASIEQRAA